MNKVIQFASPDIGKDEAARIRKTIDSRWIAKGPAVKEFEQRIADMSCCDRAVAFDSCTGAMEMTLRALGIGPGDEVITTPYTYSATAEVIRNVGAKIVFVDLQPDSFEMDYRKVEEAITERTKAVMPVDIGGLLCDYCTLFSAVNSRRDIFKPANDIQAAIGRVAVVADAAHSFGADRGCLMSGQYADFTCFSFHVLKNITTGGEGGAVVWVDKPGIDNDKLEEHLRLLGDHGQTSRNKDAGWEYDIALFGYNSIMTDIDAAMGVTQLDRFHEIKMKRIDLTVRYDELFSKLPAVRPMIRHFGPSHTSAMHLYPIHLPWTGDVNGEPVAEQYRNAAYRMLKEHGIHCNVHYKPLPMMTAYKNEGFDIKNFPNAYAMYASLLTIPYHTDLTAEDQAYIAETIWKVVRRL